MIYPVFYTAFRCAAGACRHTCCRGWEIGIDPASAARYRAEPGPLGEELRRQMRTEDGESCFRLTGTGDCPFLRPDGLCRLIAERGKVFLCEICAAHPRFFGRLGNTEYCGLGLSCEAACALLLRPGPLLFADGKTGRLQSADALFRRLLPALRREERLFLPALTPRDLAALQALLARCEAPDPAWEAETAACLADLSAAARMGRDYWGRCDRAVFRKLYAYVLYRRLEQTQTADPHAVAACARLHVTYVLLRAAAAGDPAESAGRWSAAVEYSDVNAPLLPDF